jgi:hypothetical protein
MSDEREIGYGDNTELKIAEGLDTDFVLLIPSPYSVDSKWVKEPAHHCSVFSLDTRKAVRCRLSPRALGSFDGFLDSTAHCGG